MDDGLASGYRMCGWVRGGAKISPGGNDGSLLISVRRGGFALLFFLFRSVFSAMGFLRPLGCWTFGRSCSEIDIVGWLAVDCYSRGYFGFALIFVYFSFFMRLVVGDAGLRDLEVDIMVGC